MIHPTSALVEGLLWGSTAISGRNILTKDDFATATEHAFFALNYASIAGYDLSGTKKQRIGSTRVRKCRYCRRDAASTTFRTVSHTVPEFLGNKTLVSDDECDYCNELFSRTFEHHLDILTRPWRAMFGIKGKKIPTCKLGNGTTRIDHNAEKRRIKITDAERRIRVTTDEVSKRQTIEIPCDPFIPIEVYRTLTKIGLAILPNWLFSEFEAAFKWLRAPLEETPAAISRFAKCWMCHLPSPFRYPVAVVFRRKHSGGAIPAVICTLSSFNIMFVYALPLSPRDDFWRLGQMSIPRLMMPLAAGARATWSVLDLKSRVPRNDFKYTINQTYEESHTLTKEEFDED